METTWGSGFFEQLSKDLRSEFPDMQGFSETNLKYCKRFYLFYTQDNRIRHQLGDELEEHLILQIPWRHHIEIMVKCKSVKEAFFYVQKTIENGWSRAVLMNFLEADLFSSQGKALSNFSRLLPEPQSDLANQTLIGFFFHTADTAARRTRRMKKGWKVKRLGEVCDVIAGQSPEGKFYNVNGHGIPFYQGKKDFGIKYIGEPTTWTTSVTKEAEADDILMSVRAPVGPVNFATQKICIGRGLAAIRAGEKIETQYLFHFLVKHEKEITGSTGAVFDSISKAQIENIEVPLPPLPEQKHIVAILDQCFTAIDKAKANAEQNLKNAKELFESYLQGVFEGKIQGEKYFSLDSLCELIVDCEHKTAPTQETGYPSIRTPNIGKGELILKDVNRVSYDTYLKWTKRAIPQAGDLILAREAPAGNIAVIPDRLKVCLGQRTVLLRPKKNKLVSKYLSYLILSKQVQEILLSHSTGATVQHINMKDIRAFKIYNISDLKEQQAIVQQLDALRAETQKLEAVYRKKIADLDELKKSILQKAFAGELAD